MIEGIVSKNSFSQVCQLQGISLQIWSILPYQLQVWLRYLTGWDYIQFGIDVIFEINGD